ncbi:MAG: hypothetical protein IT372_37645 [Polyangiaceae bacterium]|nr:hypothetical protein [Polyangiaceae bacterium]
MVARVPVRTRSPQHLPLGTRGAFLALAVMVVSLSFAGCPCISGPINASPGLRWFLFSNFGASRICPELLKSGVSLRLQDRSPAIGRFFPMQCAYDVNDSAQTVTVHVSGTGYGYMMPAKRVGFSVTASVEYRPDFQIAGDDMYVWGRLNRIVQGPKFQLGYVENPVVDVMANVPPFGGIANFLGNQVVAGGLSQGFTVVHNEDTGNDFTLGILFPPAKPHHPFEVEDNERYTFANEVVEVNAGQRDYLGPFEVAEAGQGLYMRMSVDSAPVDVMIVDKGTGDLWREAYQTGKPLGPPPGPVQAGGVLQPGGVDTKRYVLRPGLYYVVIDNTAAAGLVSPPSSFLNPLGTAPARVSYLAQVGE